MDAIRIRDGRQQIIRGNMFRFWLTWADRRGEWIWECAKRWRIWGKRWRRILEERFCGGRVFWRWLVGEEKMKACYTEGARSERGEIVEKLEIEDDSYDETLRT